MREKEIGVVASATTAGQNIDKADVMLSLCQQQPEHENTFAACAAVLLAAALEQGIRFKLGVVAEYAERSEEIDKLEERHTQFLRNYLTYSFWYRVKETPRVLTYGYGEFRLNTQSDACKHLRRLVEVRNKLLHIDEDEYLVSRMLEEKEQEVYVPFPKNPWNEVDAKAAKNYRFAVQTYFDEVLFPKTDEMVAGLIVCPDYYH